MKDYSQHGEQQIILDFFGDYKGTFIDIGANDGVTFSNVNALIQLGWKGTLVEASPNAFQKLQQNHLGNNNLDLINFAIGSQNGNSVFYESGSLIGEDDVSLVGSLKKDELKRWQTVTKLEHKVVEFTEMIVRVIDFKTLLRISTEKRFDFFTIDIEGMELEVLDQIDFDEIGVRLACIEWNSKERGKYDEIMKPFGFHIIHVNGANLIYAR